MAVVTVQEQVAEARRVAEHQGKTEMRRKAIAMVTSWAMTHPEQVVRDDLWDLVEKLREEL
jgi:ABC-type dipeptide/oligopeptide/nickel transport system ATPase component